MKSNEKNLTKELDFFGYWWTPDDEEDRSAGYFTCKPGAGLQLELIFDHKYVEVEGKPHSRLQMSPKSVNVFQGTILESAHYLTLLENRKIDESPGQNLMRCIYQPKYLLFGQSVCSPKDLTLQSKFSSALLDCSSLRGWLGFVSPESETGNNSFCDLLQFPVQSVNLNSTVETTLTLQVRFEKSTENSQPINRRQDFIRIEPGRPQTLEWFRDQTDKIRFLLAFLTGTPVESKRFLVSPVEAKPYPGCVDVFHHVRVSAKDETNNHRMPFPFSNLRERTKEVFGSWFGRCENNQVPIDICMGVIYGQRRDLRIEFLSLVQALESYHQITTGTHNDWIDLADRLKSVRNCLRQDIQEKISIDDEYLVSVRNTRNYYTHYNPDKRENAFKDFDLYDSVARLIPLVVAVLARDLCIPDDIVLRTLTEKPGLWGRPKILEHQFHAL